MTCIAQIRGEFQSAVLHWSTDQTLRYIDSTDRLSSSDNFISDRFQLILWDISSVNAVWMHSSLETASYGMRVCAIIMQFSLLYKLNWNTWIL